MLYVICMLYVIVMCVEVIEQCLGVSALFPTCGAGDPTQVVRPGRKHCYPLSHFTDTLLGSFKDCFRDLYYLMVFNIFNTERICTKKNKIPDQPVIHAGTRNGFSGTGLD